MNVARNTPGVVAVSMSWGFNEFRQETSYNSTFTTPAGHTGITFVAASGDSGAAGGPEWPSAAPTVVAVGGTTLYVDTAGQYQFESPWVGSSGAIRIRGRAGVSKIGSKDRQEKHPRRLIRRRSQHRRQRLRDVAPTRAGSWEVVGGTSLGTPAWAAIIAIADQGRALEGKGSLDGATQTLPTLYALPASDFNTVALVRRHAGRCRRPPPPTRHRPRNTRRAEPDRRSCRQRA